MERHSRTTIRNIVFILVLLVEQSYTRPTTTEELEEIKKALYSSCSKKFPISEEVKINAKKGVYSEDRSFKCFIMCVLDEFSLIDEDGVIDGETLVSMSLDKLKPAVTKATETCIPDIAGKPDTCEVAYNFLNCGTKLDESLIEFLPF